MILLQLFRVRYLLPRTTSSLLAVSALRPVTNAGLPLMARVQVLLPILTTTNARIVRHFNLRTTPTRIVPGRPNDPIQDVRIHTSNSFALLYAMKSVLLKRPPDRRRLSQPLLPAMSHQVQPVLHRVKGHLRVRVCRLPVAHQAKCLFHRVIVDSRLSNLLLQTILTARIVLPFDSRMTPTRIALSGWQNSPIQDVRMHTSNSFVLPCATQNATL